MRALAAAGRAQIAMIWLSPSELFPLLNAPILAVIFLLLVEATRRTELAGYAIIAPMLLGMWSMVLFQSSEMIVRDRFDQLLELLVCTPAPYSLVVLGRILPISAVSLLTLLEAWTVARFGFGISIPVRHPWVFGSALALGALATTGLAMAMASLMAVGRISASRTYQNSLTYPIYVLTGALVPASFLPPWLQILSKLIYLSWMADLLRDSLQVAAPHDLAARLAAMAILGVSALAVGMLLVTRSLGHFHRDGSYSLT